MRISDWSSDVYSSDLLGDSLHWNAFYCHAQFNEANDLRNLRRTANFALAVDSVRDPVTNAPICRVALTVANWGCVPINLFGEGAPSQQARDYVLGTGQLRRSEEHTSELQSLMRTSYDVFCLKKQTNN